MSRQDLRPRTHLVSSEPLDRWLNGNVPLQRRARLRMLTSIAATRSLVLFSMLFPATVTAVGQPPSGETGGVPSIAVSSDRSSAPPRRSRISATIATVNEKVVKIFGAGGVRGLYAHGTGFLVSADGYIVTVWSHILDDETATVVLHDGRRFEAKIVGAEPSLDLAVLRITAENLPFFDLEQTATATAGTRILAFSNMFKVATGDEAVSVVHGVIAAFTKLSARRGVFDSSYAGRVYIVDAVTNNSGAAGGVLTLLDGTLVAVVGKEVRNSMTSTWVNYAMPIGDLKQTIQEIITGRFRSSQSAAAGPKARPQRYFASDFGLHLIPDVVARTPAYVDSVDTGSIAEKLGLKVNDLVLFANDELVSSRKTFDEFLGEQERGNVVRLVVRRENELITYEFVINLPPHETGTDADTVLDSPVDTDATSDTETPE